MYAATLILSSARQNVRPSLRWAITVPVKTNAFDGTRAIAFALSAESHRGKMFDMRQIESGRLVRFLSHHAA